MLDLSATETDGETTHSVDDAADRELVEPAARDGAEPPWSRCASPVNATLSETSK
jgi:hypothetical protein